jgi:hypothetical protein
VAPVVDLRELQDFASKYADHHQLIVAAGPFTAAALLRAFVTKNRLISTAVVAGGAWLAIQTLSGSTLRLIQQQFGYLQSLIGG